MKKNFVKKSVGTNFIVREPTEIKLKIMENITLANLEIVKSLGNMSLFNVNGSGVTVSNCNFSTVQTETK